MIEWLFAMPSSVVVPAVVMVLLTFGGIYFSRKKDKADMTTKNIEGAKQVWDEYEKRIARLERAEHAAKQENHRLSNAIASLEHNDIENQKWIKSLEGMHERLQADHRELRRQYDELLERYRKLKDQVEHGSSPHLRAGG